MLELSGVHKVPPIYPWRAVVAPLIAFLIGVTLAQVFYSSPIAASVARSCGGYVDLSLVAGVVVVGLVLVAFRGFRIAFAAAGMAPRTLRRAAMQLALIWGVGQIVLIAYNAMSREPLAIVGGWRGSMFAGQQLVFQFFAVAVVEEWVFRGWLIPQLYRRLRDRITEWQALAGAVLIASAVFTVCHIPMIVAGSSAAIASQLVHIEILALSYSLCYLRTGGLSVGIAFHVLSNETSSLFDSSLYAGDIYVVLFWLRLLVQPAFKRA